MDPDIVRNQRFLLVRRGYDPEAVEEFLDGVATALEEVRAASEADPGPHELEVADARRAVDEARTRAATHRLRAQRDVEALERAARQRRARLLAEIEELAAARDQLSTDLDRAVDVVDRVVQWVRRTDPGVAGSPPDAVGGTTPSVTPAPAPEPDDQDAEPDDQDAEPDPDAGPGEDGEDVVAEADLDAPGDEVPVVPDTPDEEAEADVTSDDVATEGDPDEGAEPSDDVGLDSPDDAEVDPPTSDDEDVDPADDESPEALADALPDDAVTVAEEPGVAAVRDALRAVQDEVLANLREHPRGDVDDWRPSPTRLEALDDAATDAAGDAFLTGWDQASRSDDPTADAAEVDDGGLARDALEEVRGAGDLPGLDVAADLAVALEASLARGRDAGEVEVALRERVAEVHRDVRQTRLPEAIESVLVAARHHGELARWRHDGVQSVAWVVGREQRCPGRRCRGNADDGVVAPGAAFAFGDVVPPAHPGCTCTLRPAGRDEDPG